MKRLLTFISVCLIASTAVAEQAFDDPVLQARYDQITEDVRCLMCQNNSLKDSPGFLADDLKREIRRMLREGKTNREIEDFLVARYGEFVLYRPRVGGKTLFLWLAPGVLLLGGAILMVMIIRRRTQLPIEEEPTEQA